MIQNTINHINALVEAMNDTGKPDPRVLAVAREANQRYMEYLDALLDNICISTAVTVRVDGQTIQFENIEQVAQWITSTK